MTRVVSLGILLVIVAGWSAIAAWGEGAAARRRVLASLLGWVIPGAGYCFIGKWGKGLLSGILIVGLAATGLALAGYRWVNWEDNPFYRVGMFGSAATWLVGDLLSETRASPRPDLALPFWDPGLLYFSVAGLLNLVLVLDLLGPARGETENAFKEENQQQPQPQVNTDKHG